MKRTLSILIVLTMLLAILPCVSLADAAEPKVVTIATTWQVPDYFNDTVENKKLLEQENIFLQAVYTNTEKLGLMLASNELTDIVISEYAFLSNIMANNMALNLDPILEEHIPNYLNPIYDTCTSILRMQMSGGTGNLYFFVPGQGVEYAGSNDRNIRGYIVRWDLYKQIGMPEIKDDRDYVDVLKQMVEAAGGVTEDGAAMYGIGMSGTNLADWYSRGRYIAEAATRPTYEGFLYEASVVDGTLIDGYTDLARSPFWVDIRFYNDMWNAGLLDPDCFSMTSSELSEKVKAGVYVATRSRDNSMYNLNAMDDPETLKGFVMVPSKGAVIHADFLTPCGYAPNDYTFINANTENWEAAAAVMNFYHDPDTSRMIFSGVQGVHWDYDENGKPYLFENIVQAASEYGYGSNAFVEATGGVWGGYWELSVWTNTGTHPDGYFYDLFNEQTYRKLSLTKLDQDYAKTYGFDTPSAYHCSIIDEGNTTTLVGERGLLVTLGITDIPLDIQRTMTNCNDILFQYAAELVMAEDDDTFNALVQDVLDDLAAAGEADAWAWCSEAYDASFERINPIFEDLQAAYLAHPAGRP
ncbi:MAG: hypothetical protein ACOYI8_05760 [Christensenellales bacterium]|jgi:putative aldouronate transport system substrate-binding protein